MTAIKCSMWCSFHFSATYCPQLKFERIHAYTNHFLACGVSRQQAFLHGETMPRKNHDHDPYFPSFTIAWSMVTVHSLPNGQVNGHGHPRISPQWSGQWLLPSRIVFRISKIWEYFLLFITSFTTFTAIFSFVCCEIIKNSKPPLFSTENFVSSRFIFSYDNGHWRFSPQWSMVTEGFLPNG